MTESDLLLSAIVYESIVIIIALIILALILKKYLEKRHQFTLILFVIFTFYLLTLIFSCASKIISFSRAYDYVNDVEAVDPLTIESFIVLRIVDYRSSFVFMALASAFTYVLRVKLFEESYKPLEKWFVIMFGGFTIIYQVFVYIKGNDFIEILSFILIAIYVFAINIPFMSQCRKNYKAVDNPTFKKGFLSLTLMSFFVSQILIFQLLDRFAKIFLVEVYPYGFSPFYYIGMLCALMGYFGAYFGYIRPRSSN
ncbi:MAG: hypothetical protein JW891_18695 [Candidatus Lokiarchaeota archaeon]|nr:hypothetical protein [Candidatus Lokiarchaeota archaeon]